MENRIATASSKEWINNFLRSEVSLELSSRLDEGILQWYRSTYGENSVPSFGELQYCRQQLVAVAPQLVQPEDTGSQRFMPPQPQSNLATYLTSNLDPWNPIQAGTRAPASESPNLTPSPSGKIAGTPFTPTQAIPAPTISRAAMKDIIAPDSQIHSAHSRFSNNPTLSRLHDKDPLLYGLWTQNPPLQEFCTEPDPEVYKEATSFQPELVDAIFRNMPAQTLGTPSSLTAPKVIHLPLAGQRPQTQYTHPFYGNLQPDLGQPNDPSSDSATESNFYPPSDTGPVHPIRPDLLATPSSNPAPSDMSNFSVGSPTPSDCASRKNDDFRCVHCSFTCRYKWKFNDHMRKHSTKKEYRCTICATDFKHHRDLVKHQKASQKHQKALENLTTQTAISTFTTENREQETKFNMLSPRKDKNRIDKAGRAIPKVIVMSFDQGNWTNPHPSPILQGRQVDTASIATTYYSSADVTADTTMATNCDLYLHDDIPIPSTSAIASSNFRHYPNFPHER